MQKNLPVMITGLTNDWRSTKEWVKHDGTCDMDKMSELFGETKVLVVNCDDTMDTDLKRTEMRFAEFAKYWKERNSKKRKAVDDASADDKKLYVKDWNFVNDFPFYGAYTTPEHVKDDWLNGGEESDEDEFVVDGMNDEEKESDCESDEDESDDSPLLKTPGSYKFVYCGVAGTYTPMHVDVARSYSWSVNICGHKQWILVPPGDAKLLKHADGSGRLCPNLIPLIDSNDSNVQSALDSNYPDAHRIKPVVVEQPPGALLFVPSCWAHQVRNVSDCVSINHNWFNANSFHTSKFYLRNEMRLIRNGLADFDDRGDGVLCQSLLLRKCGINQLQLAMIGAYNLKRTVRRMKRMKKTLNFFERKHKRSLTFLEKETELSLCREFRDGLSRDFNRAWQAVVSLLRETATIHDDVEEDTDDKGNFKYDDNFAAVYEVSPWDENPDDLELLEAADEKGRDAFDEDAGIVHDIVFYHRELELEEMNPKHVRTW